MHNKDNDKNPQTPDNKNYDINHPENLTTPAFNSTSEQRESDKIPNTENLNLKDAPDDQLEEENSKSGQASTPKNDDSLFGKNTKTDLGNGKRDEDDDEKEEEKLIRE